MRFEILWVVARHTDHVLRRALERGFSRKDLSRRARISLQDFAAPEILGRLSLLRGVSAEAPPVYDDLAAPDHHVRTAAEAVLART